MWLSESNYNHEPSHLLQNKKIVVFFAQWSKNVYYLNNQIGVLCGFFVCIFVFQFLWIFICSFFSWIYILMHTHQSSYYLIWGDKEEKNNGILSLFLYQNFTILYFTKVFILSRCFKLAIRFLLLCFSHKITTQCNSLGLKYIKIAQQKF